MALHTNRDEKMDAERWRRVQEIFWQALEQETAARSAFLERVAAEDPGLGDEVRELLRAHGESQALGIEEALLSPGAEEEKEVLLGARLGPHRLVRHLGRGGMGDVYLAERDDEQFHQQVAVKLVRPGAVTHDLLRRFRTERQILARLVHPHIATLLDGGLTEDGRPYLVMQYVEGLPITTYCQKHRATVEGRLRLFRQVLDAVRFAHLHLIVHRDLKPSNILVTEEGEVKLLDFGIAKLLDPGALDLPVAATRTEVRVLTPDYAAPEQFRGGAITTVTDVYALGVLLYELLTDHRPHDLAHRTVMECERLVCEEVPRRPSTVVGQATEVLDAGDTVETLTPERVSAARRTSPARLRKLLRGDLDNIVLMALRKEPSRRYASAEALDEDLHRFLTGRPVTARPDTVGYRMGKFVRRNRLAVALGTLLGILILAFGGAMAVQASRIAQHAQELEQERDRARRQVEMTTQVKALVSDLFKVLDPSEPQGKPADRLRAASQKIVQDLAEQPEIQVELMDEVLTIFIHLGLYESALDMARESLSVRMAHFPAGDPAIAWGRHRLGEILFLNSRFDEAEAQYEQALALQRARLGDQHLDVARTLVRLSRVYRNGTKYAGSETAAQEAYEIFESHHGALHRETVDARFHLAIARSRLRGIEAAPMLREVLAAQRQLFGEEHVEVAWTLTSLARLLMENQEFQTVDSLLEEALQIQRRHYLGEHPDISRTLQMVGRLHEIQGHLHKAEEAYRQVLAFRRRHLGDRHAATASSGVRLGAVLTRRGNHAEAEVLLLEALEIQRERYEPGHRVLRQTLEGLVDLYEAWPRPAALDQARHWLAESQEHSNPGTESAS